MISVGIVTNGRPALFRKCLDALTIAAQGHDLEFLILINGKDSLAEEMAQSFSRQRRVTIISRSVTLSPGEARNFLVSQSNGEWIYFADDDAEVTPMLFEYFLRSKIQNSEASVFGGPNLTPKDSTAFQVACGDALASKFGSFHCADRYRKGERSTGCDDSKLILCNLFVKADLANSHFFPNDFICAEENQALSTWLANGAIFVYDPLLEVFHQRRSTGASFALQVIKYGRGRGRLITGGKFRWFHLVPLASLCLTIFSSPLHFFLAVICYLFFIIIATAKTTNNFTSSLYFIFAILILHFSYAVGTFVGICVDAPGAIFRQWGLKAYHFSRNLKINSKI